MKLPAPEVTRAKEDNVINQFGDFVTKYIVEMGRANDTKPRIIKEVAAKCDYMAVEIAERTTPGYVAFNVYKKRA